MVRTIIGVDPGGRNVGIVIRHGDELLNHRLLHRHDHEPRHEWAVRVADVVRTLWWNQDRPPTVAVEDLNDPTPHLGLTSVRGLIDTAVVIGAIAGHSTGAHLVMVPPARHGRTAEGLGRPGLLATYPPQLVGPRETTGTGHLRHCRAAWDVAGAAARRART